MGNAKPWPLLSTSPRRGGRGGAQSHTSTCRFNRGSSIRGHEARAGLASTFEMISPAEAFARFPA